MVVQEDTFLDREITKLEDLDGKEFEEIQIDAAHPALPSNSSTPVKKKPGLKIITRSPISEDQQWTLNSPRVVEMEGAGARKKSVFQITPRNIKPGSANIQSYDKYREEILKSPAPKSAFPSSMLTRVPEKVAVGKFPKSAVPPGIITQFSKPVENAEINNPKFVDARNKSFCNSSIDPSSPAVWTKNSAEQTPKSPEQKKAYKYFKAVFFATDNDYLDKSEIRKQFTDQGLTEEQSKLFEMPPFTGTNETMQVIFEDKVCGIDIHKILLVACVVLSILIVAMVIFTSLQPSGKK
eukprot:NODE_582_length_6440_cov_0.149661.p2 type:complete len:295 gc:universal NODE_582_length_6440_cov_0.149661:5666-4782(-)